MANYHTKGGVIGSKTQKQKDAINDRILRTRVGQMTPTTTKSKALKK